MHSNARSAYPFGNIGAALLVAASIALSGCTKLEQSADLDARIAALEKTVNVLREEAARRAAVDQATARELGDQITLAKEIHTTRLQFIRFEDWSKHIRVELNGYDGGIRAIRRELLMDRATTRLDSIEERFRDATGELSSVKKDLRELQKEFSSWRQAHPQDQK